MMSEATLELINCIRRCISDLADGLPLDLIVQRLESAVLLMQTGPIRFIWRQQALNILDQTIELLSTELESVPRTLTGRPKIELPVVNIELLLSLSFKLVDIAKLFGVSKDTVVRRLQEHGISPSAYYTSISDEDLNSKILQILNEFPNTGYKRMKGFLLSRGIKVIDLRVRQAMRIVDPEGVYHRTRCNRAIVRRQYNVSYFNQLWHLDTNMKLIRWNIIIRCCIDGKSRVVVYLDASGDNTAKSNLASFMKAVSMYGVPYRTRSDKGGENVGIAQFMVQQRGTDRGSHICGRSVHNQRIERYWRDVYYGVTGSMANVFLALEQDGLLDIDNPKHLNLLHLIFLKRMNLSFEVFRSAWNNHPLSSEHNYTPNQLMIMSMPPSDHLMQLGEEELEELFFLCNRSEDTEQLNLFDEDSIISPPQLNDLINPEESERLRLIDFERPSNNLGYDIFVEAVALIDA